MLSKAISKNSILLSLFALAVAGSIALTEIVTRDKRAESLRKVKSAALEQVIPEAMRDNILLDDFIPVDDSEFLQLKKPGKIHIARKNNRISALIIPTRTPDGYAGAINSIVGVDIQGNILGVRIIQHMETPGLGDKVEIKKSDWVLDFNGKSLSNTTEQQWAVKKDRGDFDQFTGATITPRAVVASIKSALLYLEANRENLLREANLQLFAGDNSL